MSTQMSANVVDLDDLEDTVENNSAEKDCSQLFRRELRRTRTRSAARLINTASLPEKKLKTEPPPQISMVSAINNDFEIGDNSFEDDDGDGELFIEEESDGIITENGELKLENGHDEVSIQDVLSNNMLNYYTCQQCNKFFWTENSLKHHSSMCHSEKAFNCEICGKGFRFRSNLAEHRSVHTSIKPYVCKYCGKSSRLKGNLTKHILKHHKQETDAVVGKEDIIIKKGKKCVKDPKAIDFLERSMIVLTNPSLSSASDLLHNAALMAGSGKHQRSRNSSGKLSLLAGNSNEFQTSFRRQRQQQQKQQQQNHRNNNNDQASAQHSVDAIIEKALLSSTSDDSLPVEATTLLESSMSKQVNGIDDVISMDSQCIDDLESPGSKAGLNLTDSCSEHSNSQVNDESLNLFISSVKCLNGDRFSTPQSSGTASRTQCHFCGKHFRKSAGLEMHLQLCHQSSATTDRRTEKQTAPTATAMISVQRNGISNSVTPIVKLCHNNNQEHTQAASNRVAPPETTSNRRGSLEDLPSADQQNRSKNLQERILSLASCQKDIQDIKGLLQSLQQQQQFCNGSSQKLDAVLVSLDTRVARIERQMEATLNTLGNLVKMQTTMNSAFQQFRAEMSQKLQSLFSELRAIGAINGTE